MIPKNKNISILHPFLNKKGGAVNMMIYLSNLLKEEGNNVTFYTFSYDERLFSPLINFRVVKSNFVGIASKIRNSDYIIIGNSPMQFVGVFSKIFFRSRATLIWWHHHYPWYYGENTNFLILIKRYLEKFSIKFIDKIIGNSVYIKNVLDNIYSIEAEVLYPTLHPLFEKKDRVKKDYTTNIIFTYGRWVKGKNIEQIFLTYEYLKDKIPNLRLLIGGDGEELEQYKKEFKTDKQISFLGILDNTSIIHNLQCSNVFLFPSKIDSFGLTVLEAGSEGVPIVAFNVNALPELVIDGENGFLVNSSIEFSKKTQLILTDYVRQEKLSKNSYALSKRFSSGHFVESLKKLFTQ